MTGSANNTAASILDRTIQPQAGTLPIPAARFILSLELGEEDRERLAQLAAKASANSLTLEEQVELESFRNVGRMLDLLKSKARISVKNAAAARGQ